jgi:hypothetical protein
MGGSRLLMAPVARPHTKLSQRDFCKIYPNVWRRYCFYGAVYPPGPQPMNKAKMRNVLKRNKLEEDQMLILLLLSPPQRQPPQQHVAAVALRQASHTTMSLNWRSSPSSSSVLLLLPLLLLVLSATATITPCSSFADPVHICCSRLDPTYVNLQPCS